MLRKICLFLAAVILAALAIYSTAQTPAVNSGTATYPMSGGIPAYAAATTVSIGGTLLAAGACSTGTVSITGVTTAMAVIASPVTWPGDGTNITGYVSSSGVVTIKVCALVAITPTSTTYNIRVIQ